MDYQRALKNRARDEYVNAPQFSSISELLLLFSSLLAQQPSCQVNALMPVNEGITLAGGMPNQVYLCAWKRLFN